MSGFYRLLEQNIVDKLKAIERSAGIPLAKECKPYHAEFGGSYSVPEDYNPLKSYAMVQVMGSAYSRLNASSTKQNEIDGRVVIYLGSQTNNTESAKQEVYDMIDMVEDALHEFVVMNGSSRLCTLLIDSNSENFVVPNHVCWSVTLKIVANKNY